jgi:hypothetical protein
MKPIIGVDFDNTIVCYDELFVKVARERFELPTFACENKNAVRDYLRAQGREDEWTELQGCVYGLRISEAEPYPDAIECLRHWVHQGIDVYIVSHRSKWPYRGPQYDLHESARRWLADRLFLDADGVGLRPDAAFFELTKHEKVARVRSLGCTHFIDDLPEVLSLLGDSARTQRFLFDPHRQHSEVPQVRRVAAWKELNAAIGVVAATVQGAECHG